MNNQATPNTSTTPIVDEREISLWDLLMVLARNKTIIIMFVALAGIVSSLSVMLMTPLYTASAHILPPKQGQSSQLLGQLGILAGSLSVRSPAEIVALIKSRAVSDAMVKRFSLKLYYQAEFTEDARHTFEANMSAVVGKDGVITIEFSDKSPKLAADMTNAMIEEVSHLIVNLGSAENMHSKMYLEAQYLLAKNNLAIVEMALKALQDETGLAQQVGTQTKTKLAKPFEIEKAEQAKEGAMIQVLDAAYPPERSTKPKRSLIVMMSMVVAGFLGVLFAFVREAWLRAKQDQSQMENINKLKRALTFK